ncbi:protein of unknown function [Pseudomonas mediterranea]
MSRLSRRCLLLRWSQPSLQLRHLRLQTFQPRPGTGQHDHLTVEFFPAHQVQLAEAALQQRLELAFDFAFGQRSVAAQEAGSVAAEGVEQVFGGKHGSNPENDGGSVSRSVYSQSACTGCTFFAHRVERCRTVVVRIAAVRGAAHVDAAGKSLKSGDFGTDGKVSA